jgi:hypothetical protein
MKRNLIILLITGITAFILMGCKKNQFSNANPENSIKLVPEAIAKAVAEKFNAARYFSEKKNTAGLNGLPHSNNSTPGNSTIKQTLNGQNTIQNYFVVNDSAGIPAFYVFNFSNNSGALFVSADFQIAPIVAYIEHNAIPENFTAPSSFVPYGVSL